MWNIINVHRWCKQRMSLRSTQKLSHEEEAELHRSTKKVKKSHPSNPYTDYNTIDSGFSSPSSLKGPKLSFKEKLIGEIPGAYVQAFDFSNHLDDEMESDSEVENLREGFAAVKLSKEFKNHIRAPWSGALIVKVFGRIVGFNYLHSKLMAL